MNDNLPLVIILSFFLLLIAAIGGIGLGDQYLENQAKVQLAIESNKALELELAKRAFEREEYISRFLPGMDGFDPEAFSLVATNSFGFDHEAHDLRITNSPLTWSYTTSNIFNQSRKE